MKIAFFWTWDFSRNILKSILGSVSSAQWQMDIEVCLVVSQPDKPVWRKKILEKTPIKLLTEEVGIECWQPKKLKFFSSVIPAKAGIYENVDTSDRFLPSQEWQLNIIEKLKSLELDFIVVVAYWKIVPREILEIPKYWCINLHWSILPKYRWASPIQEALKNWDEKTWLTVMYMSEGMDEWNILKIEEIEVDKIDKTSDIFKKFEQVWPSLLVWTLKEIMQWKIKWIPQDNSLATYCSKISKEDWAVDFCRETSEQIYNKFRAYYTWPWIYTFYDRKKLGIENCFVRAEAWELRAEAWEVVKIDKKTIGVVCADMKILILREVKLEWKKSMDILSFINWNKDFIWNKL